MEQYKIIQFLLTKEISYLPEDYPQVDIKKWNKKNDLQRAREVKRLISSVINDLKSNK